jgi:ketosteroid isomerase-like protein
VLRREHIKETDMSAELETVERLFDAVHRNDVQAYTKCFTEDAEYKVANFPPVYGRKDIEEFGARITPMFDKVLHEVKSIWQVADTCVSEVVVAYHKKDGTVAKVPCLNFILVKDGLVKSYHAYLDATPAFM